MKVSLKQIVKMSHTVQKLNGLPVQAGIVFKLRKFVKAFMAEFETYEETRIDLVKKYGEKKEDGTFSVKDENDAQFQDELKGLQKQEIDLPNVSMKLSDLKKCFVPDDAKPDELKHPERFLVMNDLTNLESMMNIEDDISPDEKKEE